MPQPLRSRRHARLVCAIALVTLLASAGLCAAAMLVPAPTAAVPVLALICIGAPVVGAWELPGALAILRTGGRKRETRAVEKLRRGLARLPETEHPLGL